MTSTLVPNVMPLQASDRCDRCGAQSYVRVTMLGGAELLFCRHHWHRHEPVLREKAAHVHDETALVAELPS